MALEAIRRDTGGTILDDTGQLSYNSVTWSCLYKSTLNGEIVQDNATRTTKLVRYVLEVDGVVTLNDAEKTTDQTWVNLRRQLSVQSAHLIYSGKGFGTLSINPPSGGGVRDVAYGPIPKILFFQPLGGGASAFIKWQVTFHLAELLVPAAGSTATLVTVAVPPKASPGLTSGFSPGFARIINNQISQATIKPVLQFNYGCTLTYDDEGYSGLSIKGTLEVPMTRAGVNNRLPPDIVDAYRQAWLNIVIDLTKFRVVRRSFDYSRDKRTCEWEFVAEELPQMGLPNGHTAARGTMSVRMFKMGSGGKLPMMVIPNGNLWTCTIRATYTVRPDGNKRLAAMAFFALLWCRMQASANARFASVDQPDNAPQQPKGDPKFTDLLWVLNPATLPIAGAAAGVRLYNRIFSSDKAKQPPAKQKFAPYVFDFGFDEGLYLDAKTITFEASWLLATTLSTILQASGTWIQPPDCGGDIWATSVADIMGWRGALENPVNRTADLIVDLGGGAPSVGRPIG